MKIYKYYIKVKSRFTITITIMMQFMTFFKKDRKDAKLFQWHVTYAYPFR